MQKHSRNIYFLFITSPIAFCYKQNTNITRNVSQLNLCKHSKRYLRQCFEFRLSAGGRDKSEHFWKTSFGIVYRAPGWIKEKAASHLALESTTVSKQKRKQTTHKYKTARIFSNRKTNLQKMFGYDLFLSFFFLISNWLGDGVYVPIVFCRKNWPKFGIISWKPWNAHAPLQKALNF